MSLNPPFTKGRYWIFEIASVETTSQWQVRKPLPRNNKSGELLFSTIDDFDLCDKMKGVEEGNLYAVWDIFTDRYPIADT